MLWGMYHVTFWMGMGIKMKGINDFLNEVAEKTKGVEWKSFGENAKVVEEIFFFLGCKAGNLLKISLWGNNHDYAGYFWFWEGPVIILPGLLAWVVI